MRRIRWIYFASLMLGLYCLCIAAFGVTTQIIGLVVLPFLVLVPGLLVMELLGVDAITVGVRAMYACATSFALLVFTGMLLNFLPSGLTIRTWNAAVCLEICGLLVAVGVRKRRTIIDAIRSKGFLALWLGWAPSANRGEGKPSHGRRGGVPPKIGDARSWLPKLLSARVLVIGAAVVALVVSAWILSAWSAGRKYESFTVLYGRASHSTLSIGITSDENGTINYRLIVRGKQELSRSFKLQPGDTKTLQFPAKELFESGSDPVTVDLYIHGHGEVYRWLRIYEGSL